MIWKAIKWLLLGVVYIVVGALVITIVAMFFMFVAGNVGGIGGRTMYELHSDLAKVEKSLEIVPEHRHDGMYGPVRR